MTQTKQKTIVEKQKSHAFGKDIYLLGIDEDGTKYWLEAPKWDCGWYWGFGYVETYTNNTNPHLAKDISSHSHFSGLVGYQEFYNHEKGVFQKGEYIHNVFDSPTFAATTFDEKTGWVLSELFDSFYKLKKIAEVFGKGGSNLTTNPCQSVILNKEWARHINEVMIPAITAHILTLLTP